VAVVLFQVSDERVLHCGSDVHLLRVVTKVRECGLAAQLVHEGVVGFADVVVVIFAKELVDLA